MAQKNLEPQLSSGQGAYRRDGQTSQAPPSPTPSAAAFKPLALDVESTELGKVDVSRTGQVDAGANSKPLLYHADISFSGFEPNDGGGASLFRLWKGRFTAIRSDREEFHIDVVLKQSDTPYVTGPMVQEALETLMEYRGCGCRPSRKSVCSRHDDVDAGNGDAS